MGSRNTRRAFLAGTGAAVAGLAGCLDIAGGASVDDEDGPDQVVEWSRTLMDIFRSNPETPIATTRQMALLHLSMVDAVTTITADRGEHYYEPFHADVEEADGDASRVAAIGGAGHEVLTHLFPEFAELLQERLDATLERAEALDGDVSDGEEWGRTVAQGLIEHRADDGHDDLEEGGYESCPNPEGTIGCWRGGRGGTWQDSHFAFVDTWALTNRMPFGRPPRTETQEYADGWHEIYEIGDNRGERPQEHIDIATFWRGGAGTTRPPGRWVRIANIAAMDQEPSLLETARLQGLVSLALADAGLSAWRGKHINGYWRPAPAIHNADEDGNPDTFADPDWEPISIGGGPEFPSTLTAYGSSASTVLIDIFGDDFSFEMTSNGPPEQTRSFDSFSGAFVESYRSRLYVGNHFPFTLQRSIGPAEEVANIILDTTLTPAE